jgi:hypothetical protein
MRIWLRAAKIFDVSQLVRIQAGWLKLGQTHEQNLYKTQRPYRSVRFAHIHTEGSHWDVVQLEKHSYSGAQSR